MIISNIKESSKLNGPICSLIFDCLLKNDFKKLQNSSYKNLYTMKDKFKLWNGDIYFENRWFVPLHLRGEILKEAYKVHLGITFAYNTFKELYFWSNLYTDIKSLIQNCQYCALSKRTFYSREPYINKSIEANKPW